MDQDFTVLYPMSSWASESVLRIGQVEDAADDTLRVTNDSMHRLTYLLIETYRDKFVLFDVEPRAVVTLQLHRPALSRGAVSRFGKPVRGCCCVAGRGGGCQR